MRSGGSFRRRVFLALLAVALLSTGVALTAGTLAVRGVMSGAGTAGPWTQVAESGRVLLDQVETAAPGDTLLLAVAREHREALSASLRFSRLYALVADRFLALLPFLALGFAVLAIVPALLLARTLSRSLSDPVRELAGWTERIARGEPLPPPGSDRGVAAVEELEALRGALRRMEAELTRSRRRELEAARLRSWTEMARRVAHELKNPLTPMRMAAVTVSRRADPATATAAEVLLEEIDRLDEMARSFAQFGRMPEGPLSEVDLRELLETLARQHDRPELRVEAEVWPTTPRIRARYDALGRVLRNLVVNAVEAAEAPGAAPDRRVRVEAFPEGNEVVLRVLDSGPGIDEGLLETIWAPDFTTKRRGSGIGLALVRQTVEAHGGSVAAGNQPGGGAVFTLRLPQDPPPDSTGPSGVPSGRDSP